MILAYHIVAFMPKSMKLAQISQCLDFINSQFEAYYTGLLDF